MDVTRGADGCSVKGSSFECKEGKEASDPEATAVRKEGWKKVRKMIPTIAVRTLSNTIITTTLILILNRITSYHKYRGGIVSTMSNPGSAITAALLSIS